MQVDPEYLRQHYASLSDEALLEIDRADLVETAHALYDKEVERRKLHSAGADDDENFESDRKPHREQNAPVWLEEGAEVYSTDIFPGSTGAADADHARDALESAGIPCYLDTSERERPAAQSLPEHTRRWHLIVPGDQSLRAASVLERDIFNQDLDADWRNHLEMLSDKDLREARPQVVFCGLFDRVERVVKAYNDEFSRRGLKPK